MEANHENPAPQKTLSLPPYRGFSIALTTGSGGIYATTTGPGGVQWVTAVYRHPELAQLHAHSLIDRYIRALELAGLIPFPADMQAMIAEIVDDVAAYVQGGGR